MILVVNNNNIGIGVYHCICAMLRCCYDFMIIIKRANDSVRIMQNNHANHEIISLMSLSSDQHSYLNHIIDTMSGWVYGEDTARKLRYNSSKVTVTTLQRHCSREGYFNVSSTQFIVFKFLMVAIRSYDCLWHMSL